MGRISYVNGKYISHSSAAVSIDDRGLQFGDSAYDVFAILNGHLVEYQRHVQRLRTSLAALSIHMPLSNRSLLAITKVLVAKNRLKEGMIYISVSRGTAVREHGAPTSLIKPNIIITAKAMRLGKHFDSLRPYRLLLTDDDRWRRVGIKTTMLLANCLAKTKAMKVGFDDNLFVRNGIITETSAANIFFCDSSSILYTHPKGHVLQGITRRSIIECALKLHMTVRQRGIRVHELPHMREAFITSAAKWVHPISQIGGIRIGTGQFTISRRLHRAYKNVVLGSA